VLGRPALSYPKLTVLPSGRVMSVSSRSRLYVYDVVDEAASGTAGAVYVASSPAAVYVNWCAVSPGGVSDTQSPAGAKNDVVCAPSGVTSDVSRLSASYPKRLVSNSGSVVVMGRSWASYENDVTRASGPVPTVTDASRPRGS